MGEQATWTGGEEELEERLGYRFVDRALLRAALAHPSYAHERSEGHGNERLEFLGDAVLGLAVARLLFEAYPDWPEGHLTRARAALVNSAALAERARALQLGSHARLGRTERRSGGADKERILANLFEAVLAAVYLDGGIEALFALVRRELGPALAAGDAVHERDPKTRFQEWAHATQRRTPRYRAEHDSGVEEAEDRFHVVVLLGDEPWGRGMGRTKRAAERAAAREALARAEAADDA